MKREVFETRGLKIETSTDWNGRFWIAWRPNVSMFFRERKALTRWCGYPVKTPTRDALFSWLDSLEAADLERSAKRTGSDASAAPLSDELIATGFGPEVFDHDPTENTKMII
jgi:hypothetical protein